MTWEVTHATGIGDSHDKQRLKSLLKDGWEPFAVVDWEVWLRRKVDKTAALLSLLEQEQARVARLRQILVPGEMPFPEEAD